MPKNKIILVLGLIIALLPVLGFPHTWESFFQVVAGLSIIMLSVWATIDRKLTLKAKAQMRQTRKVVPAEEPEVERIEVNSFNQNPSNPEETSEETVSY